MLVVNNQYQFALSKQLIKCLLLENFATETNEKAIITYVEILDACMHENLMWMFFNRKHAGTIKASDAAAAIIAEVSPSAKFALLDSLKNLIKESDARLTKKKKEGKGYSDLFQMPIASYAGSDRLIKRLMILLASARASNSSTDILKEYTAILDELLERNKLYTFTYKLFLKKMLAYLRSSN